jgi:hypothetical protein
MTRTITRELTITFRVVEEIDDEHPSLPPMPAANVYDTTCDETTSVRGPSVAKCLQDAGYKSAKTPGPTTRAMFVDVYRGRSKAPLRKRAS